MKEAHLADGLDEEVTIRRAGQGGNEILGPDQLDVELEALLDGLDVVKTSSWSE
jgi:hypothetical protein